MPLRCAAARSADFLCLAKESQQRKATPRRRRLLVAGLLVGGLDNSITLEQSSPSFRQAAPRLSEIAASFAKILRWLRLAVLNVLSAARRLAFWQSRAAMRLLGHTYEPRVNRAFPGRRP